MRGELAIELCVQARLNSVNRLSAPLSHETRTRLVDSLSTWNFKPHNLDEDDLFRVACILFEGILNTEGIAELDIDICA